MASITTYDYLLRNCYSSNRSARKTVTRSSLNSDDLIKADSDALKKVSKNLRDMEYTTDNGVGIYNNIKVFVQSYNNLIESTGKTTSSELSRLEKKLTKFVKANKDELEELGINLASSGKLNLKEETLLECKPNKIGKVFSADSDFTKTISKHATSINRFMKTLSMSGNSVTKKNSASATSLSALPVTPSTMTATKIDFKA